MSQSGFTPIQLYYSTTASTAPSAGNLANGELAINITDGKLFYKDNGGVVQVLATKGAGTIGGSNTQVQYNNAGALAGSANLTFDGTTLTMAANPVLSGGVANAVPYLNGSKVLTSGPALTFDGTTSFAIRQNTGGIGNYSELALDITNSFSGSGKSYLRNISLNGGNSSTALAFGVNADGGGAPSEQMRLTSTGLGIGTSSVDGKLVVYGTAGTNPYSHFKDASGADFFIQSVGNSDCRTGTASNHPWLFFTNGTEKMRLDSSGNLLVGATSIAGAGGLTIQPNTSAGATAVIFNRASSTGTSYPLDFRNGGSTVGYVSYTNLAVVYATMSDHRLKTVLGSITDSGSRIDALEPIEYEWKSDGSRTRGFLAHKFQEVYAGSVTGTKDAVDKDGKPVYQAMQAGSSEVIADLVAEIQSLRKRLAAAGI